MHRARYIYILVLIPLVLLNNAKAQKKDYIPGIDYNTLINNFSLDTARIHEYIKNGNTQRYTAPESSVKYYWAAYKLSKHIAYQNGIATSLACIAGYYRDAGQYTKGIFYYEQSQKYLNNWIGNDSIRTNFVNGLYHNIGSTYFYMGSYALAAKYYYQLIAYPRLNTQADRTILLGAYTGLAAIWIRMGKYQQALMYYNFAEQIALAYKDSVTQLSILNNKSAVYLNIQQPANAKYYAQKALRMAAAMHDTSDAWNNVSIRSSIAAANSNMAIALMNTDSLPAALYYAKKSWEYAKDSPEDIFSISYMLGYLNYKTGNFKKAEEYLLPALQKALKTNALDNVNNAYVVLAALSYDKGDYKTAYKYKDAYVKITDSLRGEKSSETISNLETDNKLIAQQRELLQNRLELITKANELKEKNLLIGGICAATLLISFLGINRYKNKQKLQEKRINLLQQEQEITQLKAMMEGEEKERMRIARDLHDGVSQTISAAKVNLMAIENDMQFADHNKKEKFEKIINLIDNSFKEVRTISHNMMPYALREAGLALLTKQLIDNIASSTLTINLYCNGLDEHFDSNIETVIYRVIQECINNVLKHAQATRLDISLNKDEDGLSITIEDNGVGFDSKDSNTLNGIGINNIKARVHYLHGQVEYDSSMGNGTLVSIHIPIPSVSKQ